jgi:hypothetical protein
MGASPNAPTLEDLGDRRFSFYPPILQIEHNEWRFKQSNWSEILVENTKSSQQIWIPRTYLGDVSRVDEPVMIVGLKKELEYKGGSVWPHARRVLSMPSNPKVISGPSPHEPAPPSAGQSLQMDSSESRVGRLILIALGAGVLLTFALVGIVRHRNDAVEYRGILQAELGLTGKSDYFDVVRKLGDPEADRWKAETGERQYRALLYPKRNLVIILMGSDRNSTRYIGAKDSDWKTIHSVELPGGRNTDSMLRSLPRF